MNPLIRLPLLLAALLAAGCGSSLSEQSVREFVDGADQAMLEGRTHEICAARSDDFTLVATEFRLAEGQLAAGQQQAEDIEAARAEGGQRLAGSNVSMDSKQFCRMAIESRDYFKRATMQRGDLHIELDAAAGRAVVRAHYTVKEPVYEYGDSQLGRDDRSERQTATRQTESDDESVVVVDPDGELRFRSTRSTSRSFLVARERDRRL
jgi:hypothetical protein